MEKEKCIQRQRWWRGSVLLWCFLGAVLVLGASALPGWTDDNSYQSIPMPEKFRPARNADGSERYITAEEIRKMFAKECPQLKNFYHSERMARYIVPEKEWAQSLLDAWKDVIRFTGVNAKVDTWDCENFSQLFNAMVTVRIWNAGYLDTRAAVGWLKVDSKKKWAGIPGNYRHALIFAAMPKGLFIIEPQNGRYVNIEDYPNREYIEEVFLF